jgi:integrase
MALEPAQYRALGNALEAAASRQDDAKAATILRLIALSGLRRGEAVGLKRAEVNESGRCIALVDSKEGESVRPVGSAALELLRSLPWKDDKRRVCVPGRPKGRSRLYRLPKRWRRILGGIKGLPADLTPHGLRHAYATVANELGYTEATIAALLGHSGGKTVIEIHPPYRRRSCRCRGLRGAPDRRHDGRTRGRHPVDAPAQAVRS